MEMELEARSRKVPKVDQRRKAQHPAGGKSEHVFHMQGIEVPRPAKPLSHVKRSTCQNLAAGKKPQNDEKPGPATPSFCEDWKGCVQGVRSQAPSPGGCSGSPLRAAGGHTPRPHMMHGFLLVIGDFLRDGQWIREEGL